jgi:hypothetical protein
MVELLMMGNPENGQKDEGKDEAVKLCDLPKEHSCDLRLAFVSPDAREGKIHDEKSHRKGENAV